MKYTYLGDNADSSPLWLLRGFYTGVEDREWDNTSFCLLFYKSRVDNHPGKLCSIGLERTQGHCRLEGGRAEGNRSGDH
jgi:hypothetical protein